ncbi:MAG: sulfite exporter TauE/SafE family protein [Sedimenticola sp.]|uniref:Probable membrane transporter protein n=1 Tax=Sedimenticola thiotaurini TaxID=1543721 RepID=A0A558D0R2_9GAMM|nr:sulfite exporter TauE/SafE family protein [Sedimenticola sp.]TVT54611.1 MAG: sulfite exporter TauE/SafE family protein [Sedimenticola thiotaurini]
MEALGLAQYLYAFGVLSVAYFVRGIAGFGSGLIAIPLLLLFFPLLVAVPLVVALDYCASASQGIKDKQAIQWREIWPLLPFALLGMAAAMLLLQTIDAQLLLKAVALFIITYALYSLMGKNPTSVHSRWWAIPAGTLGGLIGTAFGTGGPFYVVYLQMRRLDKTPFRATFATLFLLDGANRLAAYFFSGILTLQFFTLLAMALPVMMIGIYLGGKVHTTVSQETFRRGIGLLLICSGIALLIR